MIGIKEYSLCRDSTHCPFFLTFTDFIIFGASQLPGHFHLPHRCYGSVFLIGCFQIIYQGQPGYPGFTFLFKMNIIGLVVWRRNHGIGIEDIF